MRLVAPVVLVSLALLWSGYQGYRVIQALRSVPLLRQDVSCFFNGLTETLPKGATVLLVYAFPDPYLHLKSTRPDLQVYYVSPLARAKAWRKLVARTDFAVGIWPTMQWQGLPPKFDYHRRRLWFIRAPLKAFQIALVPAKSIPDAP